MRNSTDEVPLLTLWSLPVGKATIAAFAATVLYILWIFTGKPDPELERWVSAFSLNLPLFLFIYFGTKMLPEYEANSRVRQSWTLLILAMGALCVAEVIHILQGRPEHSIAELFFLAYYYLYIRGILQFPFVPISRKERALILLDLSIVMLASLLFLWYFLVDSLSLKISAGDYSSMLGTIYPVLDLFILACAVTMIQRDVEGVHTGGLVLIAIANAYISIADALWAIGAFQTSLLQARTISAIYVSGRAFLLLGLAYQFKFLAAPRVPSRYSSFKYLLRTLPPYLAGFLVFLFLAINVLSHDEGMVLKLSGVALGAPILALLIFYRQYLILKENMLLYAAAKEAREEAEKATRDKGEFLATMSHEIRTPMHGVIGMSELLIDSGLNEKQVRMAETLRTSGQHLLNVINDVLDLSKMDSGKLELESKPFDVTRCIQAIIDTFRTEADKKGIQLLYTIDERVPKILVGDQTRLNQVILNLFSNALKFTDQGEIELKCTSHQVDNGKAELRFDVRDTGIGIPIDRQDRMFQSFSQIDGLHGGTGLGLSISKRLCEMMGGRMWMESREGMGATFSFTIRADVREPSARQEPAEESDPGARLTMRILVVDDNPINRSVTQMMIKQLGYEADTVTNGEEASRRAREYDLLLMDIHMSGMDGLECTRRIRQFSKATQPVIIAMTASSLKGDREKYLAAGMNDVLPKPASIKDLQTKLQQWGRTSVAEKSNEDFSESPAIASLPVENRQQVLEELIDVFLTDGMGRVALMRKALSEGKMRAVKEEAHSLKGSSSVFGLQALVACCAEIEVVDESNDRAVTELEILVTRASTEFDLAGQKLERQKRQPQRH